MRFCYWIFYSIIRSLNFINKNGIKGKEPGVDKNLCAFYDIYYLLFDKDEPQYNKEQLTRTFEFLIILLIYILLKIPFLTVLKKIFEQFDFEKTGQCSLEIIPTTLTTLGVKLKAEDMEKLIKEVDKNGSGLIDFDEYVDLAKIYIEPEEDYKQVYGELRQVFMIFDKSSE